MTEKGYFQIIGISLPTFCLIMVCKIGLSHSRRTVHIMIPKKGRLVPCANIRDLGQRTYKNYILRNILAAAKQISLMLQRSALTLGLPALIENLWDLSPRTLSQCVKPLMLEANKQGIEMSSGLNYGNIMNRAMRGFIKEVLQRVADEGLPGEHHFFITLDTMHPDVEIADWLVTRYPEELTIVMQHWFENLVVQEDGFSVTLSFGNEPEALYIPYASIITFVDPSVEFGVRFEKTDEVGVDEDLDPRKTPERPLEILGLNKPDLKNPDSETQKADVVSLDSFRK